jgi:hypothetical protein
MVWCEHLGVDHIIFPGCIWKCKMIATLNAHIALNQTLAFVITTAAWYFRVGGTETRIPGYVAAETRCGRINTASVCVFTPLCYGRGIFLYIITPLLARSNS